MSRAVSQSTENDASFQNPRALAQHEMIDLARAAIILALTVAAALFVPRSLFATTPDVSAASSVSAPAGK